MIVDGLQLPHPSVAAALQAAHTLGELPKSHDVLAVEVIESAHLGGRFDRRDIEGVEFVLDVAHNPAAARLLAASLERRQKNVSVGPVMVLGMMADKDISATLEPLVPVISHWCVAPFLDTPRSATAGDLVQGLSAVGVGDSAITVCESIGQAVERASERAKRLSQRSSLQRSSPQQSDHQPTVVVAGSFVSVGLAEDYFASKITPKICAKGRVDGGNKS